MTTDKLHRRLAEFIRAGTRTSVQGLALSLAFVLALASPAAAWGVFLAPVNITAGDGWAHPHLSRSSAGELVWTQTSSRLGLVYWDHDENGDTPPAARVMYREWTPGKGWGAAARIDHSTAPTGSPGARHPALTQRADGSLFTAWHDSRNCQAAKNWMENLELYGVARPAWGAFGPSDVRLTLSSLPSVETIGDNGYCPKLASLADGRVAMTWFDFAWYTGISTTNDVSEVALKLSTTSGTFVNPSLADVIHTDSAFRAAGDESESFAVPAITADRDGILHLAWATGNQSTPAEANLYYGRINPAATPPQWLEHGRLAQNAGGAYDPAKIISDPRTGDVWLIYTDGAMEAQQDIIQENIIVRRRPRGAAAFGAPLALTTGTGRKHYPDAAVGADGRLHVVYVDDSGPGAVQYLVYDPAKTLAAEQITGKTKISGSLNGSWLEPAIALDAQGNDCVVWEDQSAAGGLYFTTNKPATATQGSWRRYE